MCKNVNSNGKVNCTAEEKFHSRFSEQHFALELGSSMLSGFYPPVF